MNTIKASEIVGDIPEGAWRVRLKSEPGSGAAGFYKKDIEVEGSLLFCHLDEAWWRETATTETDIPDTLEIIYYAEFVPSVGMVCECLYTSPDQYYSVKIWAVDGDFFIAEWLSGPKEGMIGKYEQQQFNGPKSKKHWSFRPIKSEEDKLRDAWFSKWKRQSLETAYDTLDYKYCVSDFIQFLIKAGVKLPEGE